ncbi:MAG: ParB N-terminal domain-containing protein [Sulfitobacter sp.]
MAKRKRLTPAQPLYLKEGPKSETKPQLGSFNPSMEAAAGAPPIARVAGDAATSAALEEVSAELIRARSEGRLIQTLPLDAIATDHLVRDRIAVDTEDLRSLKASIKARGQQTPIEVVGLPDGRYGLISGWRRITALAQLHAETGAAQFATVNAIERQPMEASDAYVAMVEENEIRVGLSYYERARVVARAVELGVYTSVQSALQSLFSTASKAKRSKIGSFISLVEQLDSVLRFPAQIGERLGLAISYALDADPTLTARLAKEFAANPPQDAEAEQAALSAAVNGPSKPGMGKVKQAKSPGSETVLDPISGVRLVAKSVRGRPQLVLSGAKVDADFQARLVDWLKSQS